jgi:hypothetical protein
MKGRRKVRAKKMTKRGVMASKKNTAHQSRIVLESWKGGAGQVGSDGGSKVDVKGRRELRRMNFKRRQGGLAPGWGQVDGLVMGPIEGAVGDHTRRHK